MRFRLLVYCSLLMLGACKRPDILPAEHYACSPYWSEPILQHPRAAELQGLVQEIVSEGVVGMMLSVSSPQGSFDGAAGKADLASKADMQPCGLTRVGSTVKTFTAVTIMMLAEEGKLKLDDKLADYLTAEQIEGLENADQATIRQALNHSSGIANYIVDLRFQTSSINDLEKVWQPEELLAYARGRSASFAPGEDVSYTNTGYVLLGMVIEKITGRHFYDEFKDRIFLPLGMSGTQFAAEEPIPARLARGYIDFYSNGQVMESTTYSGWDYYTADGALLSNAHDLSVFMDALFNGKLLKPETMGQMMQFQAPQNADPDFFPISYGLGIFKIETEFGPAYMHSGDAIGYYAHMAYFPGQKTTVVWAVNSNYGKIDEKISSKAALQRMYGAVMN